MGSLHWPGLSPDMLHSILAFLATLSQELGNTAQVSARCLGQWADGTAVGGESTSWVPGVPKMPQDDTAWYWFYCCYALLMSGMWTSHLLRMDLTWSAQLQDQWMKPGSKRCLASTRHRAMILTGQLRFWRRDVWLRPAAWRACRELDQNFVNWWCPKSWGYPQIIHLRLGFSFIKFRFWVPPMT